MAFNSENKVSYKELAPSLQELIDSKASTSAFTATQALVSAIYANVSTVRINIGNNPNSVSSPVNDREMYMNSANHGMYGYSNGWYICGGCYS